ncbi:hypothetical protein IVA88_22660 [Bradyrhizobium sp. 149]|uniref:hypothetical protein n=1 Tax=Bradyrhizobium sp. 149 TaxID=2782624 RepID=UPI001FFBCD46|nr:hypothetical protein [Bradyrhizobium sp. 149]MCK1654219.1 hypothetical protein [Bradyrhizobium sp. 149]
MTETISNANAAASTLFLGQNGEWWDLWLIVSVVAAAIAATAVGVTTAGSLISHKREAAQAEETLDHYKLETAMQIAEANARQKEAEFKLAQLRKLAGPREINFSALKEALGGQPKAPVEIWYVPEVSDGYWFASNLFSALHMAGWDASWPQAVPKLRREDVDKVMPDVSGQLFSLLLGQPPAMSAGGQPSGITVVGDGDHTALEPNAPASPFQVLFQALSKSTEFGMYGSGGSQFMPVPKGALRVVIAAKTDPIFVDNPTSQRRGTNP